MAIKKSLGGFKTIESNPKNTRQGCGSNTR